MSNGMEIQLLDVRQHKAVLLKQQEQLDRWCTTGEVRGEALIRYALAEMETNEDLRACTPTSVYLALLACGVTGLVPGKLRGYSFLVPFGNTKKDGSKEYKVQEATFMMGWKGVKHIGYRTGLHLVSAVIHENDKFDFDVGTQKFVTYKPALRSGGPVIGAAAWCELPRGGLEVEYLNTGVLEDIKNAASRFRKSPAWEGPFKDQMQRKSALKRLGKQVEMGEEFLKADAIEVAQDEHGDPSRALDELTDGSATKFLGQQTAEAATFGHLPRPTQVQVPAQVGTTATAQPASTPGPDKLATSTDKARAADKTRKERPTAPATSSTAPPSSGAGSTTASPSQTTSSPGPTSQAAAGPSPAASSTTSPTSPTPATSSVGSASQPASAATPAASSPPASPSVPASAESAPASSPANSNSDQFGDVASEPALDDAFDTSFGESDDPVDRHPETRESWLRAFEAWAVAHPTREDVLADDSWLPIFRGWLASCSTKAEMEADKASFTNWSKAARLSSGRKADPAKGIAAIPPDRQIVQMQDGFAARYKELP